MPRPRRFLPLLLLWGLAGGPALRAEDPPQAQALDPRLTLERVFGGPPITAPLPDWSWRPGHSELVRVVTRAKHDLLLALEPTSGVETTLLDLTELEALVPGAGGPGERTLGRGGPARLLWTPDGHALCVLVKGERVWVDLASGAKRRLTESGGRRSDVQVSPDGAYISFERNNQLWIVATDGSSPPGVVESADPDVLIGTLDWLYPEELGLDHAAWWSPDETQLAVLELDQREVPTYLVPDSLDLVGVGRSMRYPYAGQRNPTPALLITSPKGRKGGPAVRIPVAGAYVTRVTWTPDSRRVLVASADRAQMVASLTSYDPLTGIGQPVAVERDGAWLEPATASAFLDARRFLWRVLREGHERWSIVTLPAAGAEPSAKELLLTPEDFVPGEVIFSDVPGHAHLVSGHLPGARRSGLWLAPGRVDTPPVTSVRYAQFARCGAEEPQHLEVSCDDLGRLLLVRRSNVLTPPVLEVRERGTNKVVRTLGDARTPAFDALELPAIEEGETDLGDGARALWRLFKPREIAANARLPLILSVYGGPGSRTVEDRFGGGATWTALLVQRGFAVLQVDGRGTGGQGPRHERLVRGRLGDVDWAGLPQVIADVAGARPWLDPARVGIWGWSFGGSMACDALTRRPDVFRCGVAVAPVTDWRLYDTIYTERYMGLPDEEKAAYDRTSSVERAKTAAFKGGPCRLLLLHGLADDNVHPVNTLRLVEALLAAEKTDFAWHLYANRGHGLGGVARDVHRRALEWFERHLTPQGGSERR